MILLIPTDELDTYTSRNLIPLSCEYCSTLFYKEQHFVKATLNSLARVNKNRYCSASCRCKATSTIIEVPCTQCGALIQKPTKQIKKSGNSFCNCSCAATYNNQHKTWGTRRSKLEVYLEQQLKNYYPALPCLCNNKETIGSELDFYFPTLKLAIELNGIFHYEPIYGQDTLDRIQVRDDQKSIYCYKYGIEFCSIDSSTCSHLTQANKDKYWQIFQDVLQKVIGRVTGNDYPAL